MKSLLFQLTDSAFPSGAFAHSAGLEALRQLGQLRGEAALSSRLEELMWNAAHGALPFLHDAFDGDARVADQANEVFLVNHVSKRASRAQGRAFLVAAEAILPRAASLRNELEHSHFAVVFGACLRDHVTRDEARHAFLFSTVRSALSAAVRLNVVGPLRAQVVLLNLDAALQRALETTVNFTANDASNVSPWLETAQSAHDRLYSRLFQS